MDQVLKKAGRIPEQILGKVSIAVSILCNFSSKPPHQEVNELAGNGHGRKIVSQSKGKFVRRVGSYC